MDLELQNYAIVVITNWNILQKDQVKNQNTRKKIKQNYVRDKNAVQNMLNIVSSVYFEQHFG